MPVIRKIVFVIGSLNIGGSEKHLADVARLLVHRDFKVTIYCISEVGPLALPLLRDGVRVIGPPAPIGGGGTKPGRSMRAIRLALSMSRLVCLLIRERPQVVHSFLPIANILGTIAARGTFVKRLLTSRRSLNRYQQKHPILGWTERFLNHHVDAIVANSEAAARELTECEGIRPERVHVIRNGIELEKFQVPGQRAQTRRQLGLESSQLILIIVANLIAYKGHLDLIAALGAVAETLPSTWRLLIVGRDDGIGEAIQAAAQCNGIDANVRLLGPRSDVPHLLSAADIGILASHEEGLPTAAIEYMAAGLPVIATRAGGTGEVVLDGVTGFLVRVGDPEAIGAALLKIARAPDARRRLGEAGRARAQASFSLEACVEAYERLYDHILGFPTRSASSSPDAANSA